MMINMMIIMIYRKFIYMLRIQMKQNTNIWLKNLKTSDLNTVKIQRLFLNIQLYAGCL